MQELEAATKVIVGLGHGNGATRAAWLYAMANLVVALSLHLLFICSDVMTMSTSQRRQHILDRLTFGSLDRGHVLSIVDATLNIAKTATSTRMIGDLAPALPSARQVFAPPPYADDTVGLVERALLNPEMYHQLPRVLDFTIFGQGLGNGSPNPDELRDQFGLINPQEAIKAVRNIFAFLSTHTSFSAEMLLRNALGENKVSQQTASRTSDEQANYATTQKADVKSDSSAASNHTVQESSGTYIDPSREEDRKMTIEQLELIASGKANTEEPSQQTSSEFREDDRNRNQ
jgi:hypothetical protein